MKPLLPPSSGIRAESVAARMPGVNRTRSISRSKNACCAASVLYLVAGRLIPMVRTLRESTPMSACRMFSKLRTRSPAPTSRASDRAISATADRVAKPPRAPPGASRPVAGRIQLRAQRDRGSLERRQIPNRRPVRTAAPSVKRSRRPHGPPVRDPACAPGFRDPADAELIRPATGREAPGGARGGFATRSRSPKSPCRWPCWSAPGSSSAASRTCGTPTWASLAKPAWRSTCRPRGTAPRPPAGVLRPLIDRVRWTAGIRRLRFRRRSHSKGAATASSPFPGGNARLANQLLEWNYVTPDYLRTFGILLLEGRNFTPADEAQTFEVARKRNEVSSVPNPRTDALKGLSWPAMVNRTMARLIWGKRDPLGTDLLARRKPHGQRGRRGGRFQGARGHGEALRRPCSRSPAAAAR